MINCSNKIDDKTIKIDDKTRALLGGPASFSMNFFEYAKAIYPRDIEKQDELLSKSKEYYNKLEIDLIEKGEFISDISTISFDLTLLVNKTLEKINFYIK